LGNSSKREGGVFNLKEEPGLCKTRESIAGKETQVAKENLKGDVQRL